MTEKIFSGDDIIMNMLFPYTYKKSYCYSPSESKEIKKSYENETCLSYDEYEDKDGNYYYAFDLCGIPKENIEITKKNSEISIKITENTNNSDFEFIHKMIKSYNGDISTIFVNDKYNDEPSVTYENGKLTLKFTLKPQEKPKKITIK